MRKSVSDTSYWEKNSEFSQQETNLLLRSSCHWLIKTTFSWFSTKLNVYHHFFPLKKFLFIFNNASTRCRNMICEKLLRDNFQNPYDCKIIMRPAILILFIFFNFIRKLTHCLPKIGGKWDIKAKSKRIRAATAGAS